MFKFSHLWAWVSFALLIAASAAFALAQPDVPRRYRIECAKIRIEKGGELTVANLSGGVSLASRDGMTITADSGLVKVVSRIVEKGLEQSAETAEAAAIGGGGAAAREREPAAISPDDVKHLELSGRVILTGKDGVLKCDAIYSEDGGRTWRTRAGASFDGKGENAGTKFTAGELKYDAVKGMLTGGGGASVKLPPTDTPGGGKSPVSVKAGGFTYDSRSSTVTLTGSPVVEQEGASFSAGTIVYSAKSGAVTARGGARVNFPERGVEISAAGMTYGADGAARFTGGVTARQLVTNNRLTCDSLDYHSSTGSIEAKGSVRLAIPREDIVLTAGRISGNFGEETGAAKDDPELKRGGDFVKGEEIRFRRSGEKIVVEVIGGGDTEYSISPESFTE